MEKSKKKWTQTELPAVKKMVEELYNPNKDDKVKQYQVKDEKKKEICLP